MRYFSPLFGGKWYSSLVKKKNFSLHSLKPKGLFESEKGIGAKVGKKVGFFNVFCSSHFFANVITLMANNKEKGRLADWLTDKQEEEEK